MYKISLKLRTQALNKQGEAPVNLVFTCLDDKSEFARATGVSCKPSDFNAKAGKVKPSDVFAADKNERIAKFWRSVEFAARGSLFKHDTHNAATVRAVLDDVSEQKDKLQALMPHVDRLISTDIDECRARIATLETELEEERQKLEFYLRAASPDGELPAPPADLFTARIAEYVSRQSPAPKPSTVRGYENLQRLVEAFSPGLDITSVNLRTLNNFQNWLIEVKGCKNQGVNSYTTRFKAILKKFAIELDMNITWLSEFKPVSDKANKNIVFLSQDELADIRGLDLSKWRIMHEVREQFLLCCETGLRHSDLNKVTKAAIEPMPAGDGQLLGYKQLRVVTEKNGTEIIVPVTPAALEILERNSYRFPSFKLRNYNQALESIARRCPSLQADFTRTHHYGKAARAETKPKCEFVQSHSARRTFINNAILRGVSESTVATWVGHSDVKQIQNSYSHRPTQAAAEAHKILL